jgi:hypothetical protein
MFYLPPAAASFQPKYFENGEYIQANNYGIVRNEHGTTVSAFVAPVGICHLGRRVYKDF